MLDLDAEIVPANKEDLDVLAELGVMLWPEHGVSELKTEFAGLIEQGHTQFFLMRKAGENVGFAQCALRFEYVEGCTSSPTGYLEGILVRPEFRRRGYAQALIDTCINWARQQGCSEFASDCWPDNDTSIRMHHHAGFTEVGRVVCFIRKI